jgi:hypothetical protein
MGRKTFSTRLDELLIRDMKILAVTVDKSVEELTKEAFLDLLKKYNYRSPLKKRRKYPKLKALPTKEEPS